MSRDEWIGAPNQSWRRTRAVAARVAIGFLLVGTALGTVGSSIPAQAATSSSTSLTGLFSSMAIDASHSHVFVSLPSAGTVEVLDFSGNVIDTITGFGTRFGVTNRDNDIISADNAIFMTDTANGTVDRIDPSTFAVTTVGTGLLTPQDLVYSAGSLWTESNPDSVFSLVSIDITTGTVTRYPNFRVEGSGLASGDGLPGTIFSYTPFSSPEEIQEINVSSTPIVVTNVDEMGLGNTPEIDNVSDISVSPDGSHLVPVSPEGLVELDTSTLLGSGIEYRANGLPTADAMTSANGGLFAAGLSGEEIANAPNFVTVFPMDDPSDELISTLLPSEPVFRGVAFSPNGGLLFVVTAAAGFGAPEQFQVVNIPTTSSQPQPSSGGGGGGGGRSTPQPTTFTIAVNNSSSTSIATGVIATLTESGLPSGAKGTVTFLAGGVTICSISLSGVANEATGCPSSPSLAAGNYVVTAVFSDTDGNFLNSASSNSAKFAVGTASSPPPSTSPTTATPPVSEKNGYLLVGSDGGIFNFGSTTFYGSTGSLRLQRPVVGITPTSDHGGYWLVASDGGIFAFGDAGFYGSIPGLGFAPAGSSSPKRLNAPIVGMVPSADGNGYFLVASDGGVFTFGDAKFEGSCPSIGGCSGATVTVMPDSSGNGYWLVTVTGHVYAFGDVSPTEGAPGPQSEPVTSAVATPDGGGYWILLANGAVDAYGDASNFGGPAGSLSATDTATAIFPTSSGKGYWVASANGSVFTYGDAPYDGGVSGLRLNGPIVAATGW